MQTVVRQTWTGCILGLRQQAHSTRAAVLRYPSSRRQLCIQPRLLHYMEFARPAKRQCTGLVVADTRAGSTVTLSTESPEQEQQLQQTIVPVKSTTPEPQARSVAAVICSVRQLMFTACVTALLLAESLRYYLCHSR